jgi:hypothetical protein
MNTYPLAKITSETQNTMTTFPPPNDLKHRAIFMMPYAPFDGCYIGNSDAPYLSIGLAQWRKEEDTSEISAKVWRYTGEKWSRMSEEIPLHRLVDLCILLTKTFYQSHTSSVVDPIATIPAGTFENQNEQLELRNMHATPKMFKSENERIKARLRKLLEELNMANLNDLT